LCWAKKSPKVASPASIFEKSGTSCHWSQNGTLTPNLAINQRSSKKGPKYPMAKATHRSTCRKVGLASNPISAPGRKTKCFGVTAESPESLYPCRRATTMNCCPKKRQASGTFR
jgi:hypothetical protein